MGVIPRTVKLACCAYLCVGLLIRTGIATNTEPSETNQPQSDKTLNLEKRDVDNFELYGDPDKREEEEVTDTGDGLTDDEQEYDFDNLDDTLVDHDSELFNNGGDTADSDNDFDVNDKDKRYKYYGFESQLGKRGGPMGFMTQLGKRNFGYYRGQNPTRFIDRPGRRGPMGFIGQLGKRGGPMGFYAQLGKRGGPMGFYAQLGKRGGPMGFYPQLGKRGGPMGFYAQLGKRGPMGFLSQLGKRETTEYNSESEKRNPMGFLSQLGKRTAPMAFWSQLGKRTPMGFYGQLGKRAGPMGFLSQLGKRSDLDVASSLNTEFDTQDRPLSRRKRSLEPVPWELIRQRLALNRYVHPYNRFGFRGRMGKRYPSFRYFSQLG